MERFVGREKKMKTLQDEFKRKDSLLVILQRSVVCRKKHTD